DRALGRGQADVGAIRGRDVLVADVGLVVAQADERAEGLVCVAEVVLGAERDRLRLDGTDLAGVAADAVVEAVRRAPQLQADVVGGVPGGAERGRHAAVGVDARAGQRIGIGLQEGAAADHGEALARGGAAVLGECGSSQERGDGGRQAEGTQGMHGGLLIISLWMAPLPLRWTRRRPTYAGEDEPMRAGVAGA